MNQQQFVDDLPCLTLSCARHWSYRDEIHCSQLTITGEQRHTGTVPMPYHCFQAKHHQDSQCMNGNKFRLICAEKEFNKSF